MNDTYEGTCFGGNVEFEGAAPPPSWATAIATTVRVGRLRQSTLSHSGCPTSIRITKGEARIGSFHKY
jgi:hypothetical protein